jgi:hypothetical protein
MCPGLFFLEEETYSSLLKKFDHAESFLDIGNFLLEADSALRQAVVHVAIFPILQCISGWNRFEWKPNVRKSILEVSQWSVDLHI